MPAMSAASDPQIHPNSNLHEPFLRRAADAADGHESGVALGGFLTLRLADIFDQRLDTLSADALIYQIQATADYLHDLHPVTAEVKHMQEIVRTAHSAFERRNRRVLWPPLLAYAFWLEQEIRLDEALDVLDTAMRLSVEEPGEEEVATMLQRARVLRLSGALDEARDEYAAAGELAMRIGDAHSERLSRIGRGIVLQVRGNLPESERVLKEVLKNARAAGDRDAEARACHDLAGTYHHMRRFLDGVPLAFRAFQLYEHVLPRLRALSDLGQILLELDRIDAAEDAFQVVVDQARDTVVEANAMNELMYIASRRGDRVGFERWRKILDNRLATLPPEAQTDYHLKVGRGLAHFGDSARAREEFERALELADVHRMHQFAFQAEAAIGEVEALAATTRSEEAEDAAVDPEVAAVAHRLHELRIGVGA